MKSKRLAALALAGVMTLALCTGCGPGGGSSGSPVSKENSGSADDNEKTAAAKAALDFNGETIKIVYPPEYGFIDTTGKDAVLAARNERIKQLEEKYHVKVEQSEGKGNYWQMTAVTIAAGEPAGHIMITQDNKLINWLRAGALAELDAAMEKTGIDFTDGRYNQTVRTYSNFNGKQYGFFDAPLNPNGAIWYFNKRIFREENLGDPFEMVKNKTWTWDKVAEIAQRATKKDSNGTVTQWGLSAYLHYSFLLSLANSNGGGIAGFDEAGAPKLKLTDANSMKAFETMYDWAVNKKIANINTNPDSWDKIMKDFTNGNSAICVATNKLMQYAEEAAMVDEYGIVYAPIGPDADDYRTDYTKGTLYFIPKTYEGMADKLLLLMDDILAFDEGKTQEDLIIEKYISRIRDKESLAIYTDMATNYKRVTYDNFIMTGLDWTDPSISSICNSVLKGEKTPGDAVEQNKTQLQTTMEDMMKDYTFTGK